MFKIDFDLDLVGCGDDGCGVIIFEFCGEVVGKIFVFIYLKCICWGFWGVLEELDECFNVFCWVLLFWLDMIEDVVLLVEVWVCEGCFVVEELGFRVLLFFLFWVVMLIVLLELDRFDLGCSCWRWLVVFIMFLVGWIGWIGRWGSVVGDVGWE